MPVQSTEIKKYAYAVGPGHSDGVTATVSLHDAAGKHFAEVRFFHAGPLPAGTADAEGMIAIPLWESALPVVLDMLRSGVQVYAEWDGASGRITTALSSTG